MMQASTLWNWAAPAGRDNGPVGGRCSACTQGSIACTLPQNERMSTVRSLSTGRWRSGSMLITPWRSHSLRTEVRQASFSAPLMVIAHDPQMADRRSEEHTSELQSRLHLVCRLLLEKKKIITKTVQPCYI